MNFEPAMSIARAILYEGYLLYPYRSSALKNRYRWTFGCVFPPEWKCEPAHLQTDCLVRGGSTTAVTVKVRFLQLIEFGAPIEREVVLEAPTLIQQQWRTSFRFDAGRDREVLGEIALTTQPLAEGGFRVTLRVDNRTPCAAAGRDEALSLSLLSCHALLGVEQGQFVSLLDPPTELSAVAAGCQAVGWWPVLVGERDSRQLLLAAPIILEDYPRVAAESPADAFDATEIDELLTLRILTLTDEEKRAMADGDDRTRALLEQTAAVNSEQLHKLHGVWRVGTNLRVGSRVRLRPHRGGDIFDLALAGRTAVVAAIEEDHEGRLHLSVVVEDDPGMDLGLQGKPGHRFFFAPGEVESLDDSGENPDCGRR